MMEFYRLETHFRIRNPLESGQRAVFRFGDNYFGVETGNLPTGSVTRSGAAGHLGVTGVAPAQLKDAVVVTGKMPN
jgi:hypothetical protein